MYTCAYCTVRACGKEDYNKMPANCPMKNQDIVKENFELYKKEENYEFYIKSSEIEALGWALWSRLKDTVELCKHMNYKKIGVAFCRGLSSEAKVVCDVFRKHNFETVSIICKVGGIAKEKVGIDPGMKVRDEDVFEPICNPILQAKLMNEQKTDFNVIVGLCVGHDSLFTKYSDALCSTLIAKDRALANNPVGAIYCQTYMKHKLDPSYNEYYKKPLDQRDAADAPSGGNKPMYG